MFSPDKLISGHVSVDNWVYWCRRYASKTAKDATPKDALIYPPPTPSEEQRLLSDHYEMTIRYLMEIIKILEKRSPDDLNVVQSCAFFKRQAR